jgi:hypothetical protein
MPFTVFSIPLIKGLLLISSISWVVSFIYCFDVGHVMIMEHFIRNDVSGNQRLSAISKRYAQR